jgi:hypothetical protein
MFQTRMAEHLLVRFPGGSDVRTVQQVGISGIQSSPSNGSLAIMTESGPVGSLKFATATDNFAPWGVLPGEIEIFSDDGYMDTTKNPPVLAVNKLGRIVITNTGAIYFANVSSGVDLKTTLLALTTALTTFCTALTSGVPASSAACSALATAISNVVTKLTVLLAASHA